MPLRLDSGPIIRSEEPVNLIHGVSVYDEQPPGVPASPEEYHRLLLVR